MSASVVMVIEGTAPETPASSVAAMYAKTDHILRSKGSDGVEHGVTSGSGTLTAGTSTVVTDANVVATSIIMLQARSAAFVALAPYVSAKAAGSFTITCSSAAGTETFDYVVVN